MNLPNKLTLLRVILVPVFMAVLYWDFPGATWAALVIFILASLTDLLDGQIARRFNQVSDLGKLLDPIADKLTQGAMLICLVKRFPRFWIPLILMIAREAFVGVTSLLAIKKSGHVEGAEMHGKVATVMLYALALSHLLFGDMPRALSDALIAVTTAAMAVSFVLYAKKNLGIMRRAREHKYIRS